MTPLLLALLVTPATRANADRAASPETWPTEGAGIHAVTVQSERPDRWFGEDKLKHVLLSCGVTNFAFAGARALGLGGQDAVRGAVVAALVAGVGKEVSDRQRGRGFSVKDLVWDIAGIGAGVALAEHVR